jgi:hypothetical protein
MRAAGTRRSARRGGGRDHFKYNPLRNLSGEKVQRGCPPPLICSLSHHVSLGGRCGHEGWSTPAPLYLAQSSEEGGSVGLEVLASLRQVALPRPCVCANYALRWSYLKVDNVKRTDKRRNR